MTGFIHIRTWTLNLVQPGGYSMYDIWYDIFVNCNWVVTRWQ